MSVSPLNILDLYGSGNSSSVKFGIQSKVVIDTTTITSCVPGYPPHTGYPPNPGHSYPPHGGDQYVTVYTTEYIQVCPTETPCPYGTQTNTYTITETCTGDKHDYTRPLIPPHFTAIVKVCDVCEGKPTLTVTCPIPEKTTHYEPNNGWSKGCNGQDCYSKGATGYTKGCNGNDCYSKGADNNNAPPKVCNGNDCSKGSDNNNAPPKVCQGNDCSKDDGYKQVGSNGGGDSTKYLQANMAPSGRGELAVMVLGAVVGVAAWFL